MKDVLSSLHPVQKVEICHEQVVELFQRVNICKASGPDGICGRTLRFCAHQLGGIFQHLFQRSMDSFSIPAAWKLSTIVPVPKKVSARHLNDFRPVALTSLVMKVFESIIKALILKATNNCLNPLQFAYQSKQSIDDAKLFILHTLLKHLENPQAHARLLFADFSSAFNTIQSHILARRLLDEFSLDHLLVSWIIHFLVDRQQRVLVNGTFSDLITTCTGSPQGCVLSPLLFILYTNSCHSRHEGQYLVKFSDDTALLSLLSGPVHTHGVALEEFIVWCDDNFLELNMLIGLAGYLTGYDGSFSFAKPGDEYGDTPYMGMRVFCAILGAALVPMTFQIIWQFTSSILPAIFAASFVLFDVGTNTLSRYILLDPILMFFILAATYCKLRVLNLRKCPFSFSWWFWLTATGVSLAGAMGVKFVGLFVVLLVGVLTARDLNMLLSDLTLAMNHLIKHLIARIICLITVPFICYLLFFHIHFKVLNHSGSGDGFFSSAFQSQLIGNKLYNVSMPENVAFGSIITLKQRRIGGAYLHSHPHLYPEDHPPRQQQVTTYSHKDDNNLWKVKPADQDVDSSETVTLLKSGDLVRLEHVMTQRNLHSHREPAPLSKRHYQVSGYGVKGTGDANDIWLVEVAGATPGSLVQTVRSRIRFVHYYVRCALFSHEKKLPKWGWEQLEATCTTNIRDPRAQWSVEEVHDNRLPNVSFDLYSPSFLEKFLESHAVMSQGNSGLKPKEGEITSRPWQWPINYRGQIFSGKEHRIYLLGNPVLFWSALVLKALFFVCYLIHTIRKKRGSKIDPTLLEYNDRMFRTAWWLLLAWGLHYLPFWFMSRVLYFHHYFPAFLFSAMFCGVMLDYVVRQVCLLVPDGLHVPFLYSCMISFMGLIVYSFYLFHPLAYGMQGNPPSAEGGMMEGLHWLESWDF